MKLGIDIDDTTVDLANVMLKYAEKFDREVLGRKGINGNFGEIPNRYYLEALFGWTQKEKYAFFNAYYKNVLEECIPLENSAETIRKLKEEGNEIYFITARLNGIPNCDAENITKMTLEKNNIPYNQLIMNAKHKLQFCIKHEISIFMDDSFDTCKELEENGIKTFLMTTKMNQNIKTGKMERVANWKEAYEKIKLFLRKD